MIRKALLFAIALFGSYSILLLLPVSSSLHASQHQWQDNLIKAQQFIYSGDPPPHQVIVGSSLSCRLVMDSLPGTYNLSFGGQSIFDGLAILLQQSRLPETVLIEMNVALRKENSDFTYALHNPVLFYPRKWFPALREDRQPLGVMGSKLNQVVTHRILERTKTALGLNAMLPANTIGGELFANSLHIQVQNYSKEPDKKVVETSFLHLKADVDALEKRRVRVVFFEMPVNDTLKNLPEAITIRSAFYTWFSPTAYTYIPSPSQSYRTTDGEHLGQEEALRYTLYLQHYLSSGFSKNPQEQPHP